MTRRGNNEGSVSRRSDGRWEAKASLGFRADGKPVRKSFYGKTKTEARNKMNDAIRQHAAGMPVDFERQTVAQFLTGWLEDVVKPKLAAKTYASYRDIVEDHLIPGLGRHILVKLTPQHVQALLRKKEDDGLSPRTRQYIRAVLRSALNQALKWEQVPRNVAALVDPPRQVRKEVQPLTLEQSQRFLDAVKGDRLEALYHVAIKTGLRQGEILALTWDDVDLTNGTIRVQKALHRGHDGKLAVKEPKTRSSIRTVSVPASVVDVLNQHRDRQRFEREKAETIGGKKTKNTWVEMGLVFATPIGTYLEPTNLTKRFQAKLKDAGLPRMTFHSLRHLYATMLVRQGIHPRQAMELLGHSNIATTMEIYSHVSPNSHRVAADLIEALMTRNPA